MPLTLVPPSALPWTGWFNRDLIENMPVAVYVCDADGVLVAYNKKASTLWGRAPVLGDTQQKFCGAHRLHLSDGTFIPHDQTPLAAILTTQQPISFEAIVGRPDGTMRNVAANLAPLFNNEREFIGFVNCVLDITDARQATENRDRMWHLSQDLMATATLAGTVKAANPAWSALGWDDDTLRGVDIDTLVHLDDQAAFKSQWQALAAGRKIGCVEARFRRHDGGYSWLSLNAVSDGATIHASARDVTKEKEQARALADAEDALRQSQKMEAIGQLTGGVAHDFNNLLQVIQGSAEILKRPDLTDERRTRYVDSIASTAGRAAKLTNQLLSFARRQTLKPELFDVAAGLAAVGDMIGTLTGSRIQTVLRLDHGQGASIVDADASQLDTAIVNLVVNARDSIDGDGKITIALANVDGVPAIRAHAARVGQFVAITVTDTGCGIGPDNLARIFEPFFTTKSIGAGTGLGLSQVFGFAKQSGGEILVESAVGTGTTFTLFMPRHIGAAELADAATVKAASATPVVGSAVLVVEDNPDVGAFAEDLLTELGYRVTLVASAQAALDALAADAAFDVVFSDVEMAGMSGLELAARLQTTHPALPVVLTSGYSHNLYEHGLPNNDLLHKPYSVAQLAEVIKRKTQGEAVLA